MPEMITQTQIGLFQQNYFFNFENVILKSTKTFHNNLRRMILLWCASNLVY